ncbi:MAG: hypothetical protein EOR51_35080 [Mesorhizobium sp.]|nr:MAG: hypothetical protein EOR51_35080 [Mesorhizobium sp.]
MMMRREEMHQAEEVAAMLRLHELGQGAKRLAKALGCARHGVLANTVRRTAFDLGRLVGRRFSSSRRRAQARVQMVASTWVNEFRRFVAPPVASLLRVQPEFCSFRGKQDDSRLPSVQRISSGFGVHIQLFAARR